MRRIGVVIGLLGGAAIVWAGCGDDSSDDDASSGTRARETTTATLSGTVNDEGSRDIAGDGENPTVEVEVDDFYFEPTYLASAAGQRVTVELRNDGDAAHTYTIDSLQVDEELDPGAEASVEVLLPDGGATLEYFCRFHESRGMRGAFTFAGGTGGGAGGTGTSQTSAPTSTTGSIAPTGGGSPY
jgi:plastocyanin